MEIAAGPGVGAAATRAGVAIGTDAGVLPAAAGATVGATAGSEAAATTSLALRMDVAVGVSSAGGRARKAHTENEPPPATPATPSATRATLEARDIPAAVPATAARAPTVDTRRATC